jgi:hypothetical protein
VGHRQRAEAQRIDELEDGGVGPDAQGQGQQGHRGEAPTLAQGPDSLAQVATEIAQKAAPARQRVRRRGRQVPQRRGEHLAVQLRQDRGLGGGGVHPAGDQLGVAILQVLGDLLDDLDLPGRIEVRARQPPADLPASVRHAPP